MDASDLCKLSVPVGLQAKNSGSPELDIGHATNK